MDGPFQAASGSACLIMLCWCVLQRQASVGGFALCCAVLGHHRSVTLDSTVRGFSPWPALHTSLGSVPRQAALLRRPGTPPVPAPFVPHACPP